MKEKVNINGIILVNKPQNLTSNAVLQRVKHLFHAKKAGHTGSLDPLATGMLPLCFGEATKFSQFLLDADKCYEVTGRLGIKTNSGDSTGEVIATTSDFTISDEALAVVLESFRGPIQQIPPMFSALKHQGLPLYKLARKGIEIERKARDVTIHRLQLIHFDGHDIKLSVSCTKGTYIRSLIEDIGDQLGVGAHITQLHRCYTAGFEGQEMHTLDELTAMPAEQLLSCLLPEDRAIQNLPRIELTVDQGLMLYQGKIVPDLDMTLGLVRLYVEKKLMGIGEFDLNGALKAKRLISRAE
ncbi:MAG: tRNA pseudouridine(55) synthase TruB [Legionellaceae bacterium]|nr:tRNA pseudouridine(55) synthase TruB [Legionellaceae bacterium]